MARLRLWLPALILGTASTLASFDAAAQSDEERAGARTAATEGYQAFTDGHWADSLDLFQRAESLVHAPPHLLFIARSLDKLGRLVEARETYMKVIRENIPDSAPKAFHAAQDSARDELAQIEPRLPKVRIVVEGAGGAEVAVLVDGKRIPPALIGLPIPLDPGKRKIEAFAEGKSAKTLEPDLAEAAHEKFVFVLEPDPHAHLAHAQTAQAANISAATPATGAAPAAAGSAAGSDARADTASKPPSTLRLIAYGSMGVGVVGVGLGTVFGLRSSSKSNERDTLCPDPNQCSVASRSQVLALNDAAGSAHTLAVVGFALGGVGLATGITLYFVSADDQGDTAGKPKQAKAEITPWVGPSSVGLSGKFW